MTKAEKWKELEPVPLRSWMSPLVIAPKQNWLSKNSSRTNPERFRGLGLWLQWIPGRRKSNAVLSMLSCTWHAHDAQSLQRLPSWTLEPWSVWPSIEDIRCPFWIHSLDVIFTAVWHCPLSKHCQTSPRFLRSEAEDQEAVSQMQLSTNYLTVQHSGGIVEGCGALNYTARKQTPVEPMCYQIQHCWSCCKNMLVATLSKVIPQENDSSKMSTKDVNSNRLRKSVCEVEVRARSQFQASLSTLRNSGFSSCRSHYVVHTEDTIQGAVSMAWQGEGDSLL